MLARHPQHRHMLKHGRAWGRELAGWVQNLAQLAQFGVVFTILRKVL